MAVSLDALFIYLTARALRSFAGAAAVNLDITLLAGRRYFAATSRCGAFLVVLERIEEIYLARWKGTHLDAAASPNFISKHGGYP
jgi:hypothetical protein